MNKLLLASAILLMASCAQNKNAATAQSTVPLAENTLQTKTIEGEVLEVLQAKDGYTVKINTKKNETFFITISRANLINPAQYRTILLGEKLKVAGDFWKMENENHITVRAILSDN